jgi:hypothetical protein
MKSIIITCIILIVTLPSFAQVPTSGLVAEYLFTNGSYEDTNPNEKGPNNATGTKTVSSTEDRFGNPNNAKNLPGIHGHSKDASYIDLGSAIALKPTKGSVSIWVKINKISESGWGYAYNPIVLATNSNSPGKNAEAYALYLDTEKQSPSAITVNSPSTKIEAIGDKVSFNEWHHYVITYDDDRLKLYVDGVLVSDESKRYKSTFSDDKIYIGGSKLETDSRALDGQVDDIRIYDRTLEEYEIKKLHREEEPEVVSVYVELGESLSDGFAKQIDNFLRFKLNQDYAVTSGGEVINYTIYKWDRTSHSGKFNLNYGTNWKVIDLSSYNLDTNTHYTLEFKANKKQEYILKFKTK